MAISDKQRALIAAVMQNNYQALCELHKEGETLDFYNNEDGNKTLLHYAALSMVNWQITKYLLQHSQLDPNVMDIEGNSPLHFNFEHPNPDFIERLLSKGANPWLCNHLGISVIEKVRNDDRFSLSEKRPMRGDKVEYGYENHFSIYQDHYRRLHRMKSFITISNLDLDKIEEYQRQAKDLNIPFHTEGVLFEVLHAALNHPDKNYLPVANFYVNAGADLTETQEVYCRSKNTIAKLHHTVIEELRDEIKRRASVLSDSPYLKSLCDYFESATLAYKPSFFGFLKQVRYGIDDYITLFSTPPNKSQKSVNPTPPKRPGM